jgi:zinc protease
MKKTALTLGILSSLLGIFPVHAPALAAPAQPQFVRAHRGIQEFMLANGLKVLLVENHAAPVISTLIVYRVGSRNEAVGYTGSTHFLEHMLFKGTPTFNKASGTQIAQTLQAQGARFNATTWLDRTNYFETLPADKLDLALRLEADRMRNSFIADADRKSEMSVVRNELERGENNPDRVMWQQLFSNAFQAHPYHHPTIGWRSDVEGVPTARLKKFYQDFYYPDNATLILVGDFETKTALEMVNQHFGPLQASKEPIPQVYTQEPPQQGERRFTLQRPGQLGIVNMGFRVPPLAHADSYALDMLDNVLSKGVTSRLYQALVEKQIAVSASSSNVQLRDPGLFVISAKMASGMSHEQTEKALWQVIENLQKTPLTQTELDKVKAQIKAQVSFNRHGTLELASDLGEYEAMADWRYMVSYLDNIAKVTPADVQRVAKTYFLPQNRTVGWFVPKAADEVKVNSHDTVYQQIAADATDKVAESQKKAPIQRLPLGKNGSLIIQENHLDQTVAIHGTLLAGSVNDPKGKAGLAMLTADMLDQGTRKLDKLALAKKLESMGSNLSIGASLERVEITGSCLAENLSETLDLLFEMLKEPAFPAAEFAKLKKQTADRLKQRLDNTDALASNLLNTALYPAGHPRAVPLENLMQEVEKLSLDDVKNFYKQHYGSNQMVLTVVGDVEANKLTAQAQSAIKDWKNDNSTEIDVPDINSQKQGKRIVKTLKDKANVSIAMGIQTDLKLGTADYFPAILANHALGQSSLSSRLGLRVRDELGLTYGIFSYFTDPGRSAGPWLVGVTTAPENVEKTIEASKDVIRKYLKEGISARELELGKSALIGSYLVGLSTNPNLADRLSDIAFYNLGDDYISQRRKQIEAVTLDQVNAAIGKYFDPDHLTTVIVGNYVEK